MQNVINKLKEKNLYENYKSDIKGIKNGFIAILFSASFVLSLGFLHSYQNLPESVQLYQFAIIAYCLAFVYKLLSLKFVTHSYQKKLNK